MSQFVIFLSLSKRALSNPPVFGELSFAGGVPWPLRCFLRSSEILFFQAAV